MKQALCLSTILAWTLFGSGIAQAQPAFGTGDTVGGASADPAWPLEEPCSFTQNEQFDLIFGAPACQSSGITTDNQYLRVFDLDVEHGFGGQICVDSLDYGTEVAAGGIGVTFNVYCTPQGLADDAIFDGIDRELDLDPGLVFSVTITHPDAEFEYFNQPLGGCCDADLQDLAIEIATEDCLESGSCLQFFGGVTDFGSTKPYYIGAPDCGIFDPINADLITGLGVQPLLMQIHATCEEVGDGAGDGADTPAVGTLGGVLLLLLVLATGLYFTRRVSRV